MRFLAKYFDQLDKVILKVFRNYYYLHKSWINFNLNFNKSYNISIAKVFVTKQKNKYILEQM